jgi:glyoxylase-like metal-dependent hydrolase (beta-lactamase superfamily II)
VLDQIATRPASPAERFAADLSDIRELAHVVPGALPLALNAVKVAASIRPRKFVVEGGDETPVTMPRTVYQLVYADGAIMIDAAMDKATHDSFGEGEPYFPDAFAQVRRALHTARLIVLTHYHADHVAGVVTSPDFENLARKTIATPDTLSLMVNHPHRPHLKITEDQAARFISLDYRRYYPLAPGLVLVKAPGHSPDMQMAYIRLQSGAEYLHSIDAAWTLDNIRLIRGKAAPWVKEDVPAVLSQLRWLNGLMTHEPQLNILVTHDGECLDRLVAIGAIGAELKV